MKREEESICVSLGGHSFPWITALRQTIFFFFLAIVFSHSVKCLHAWAILGKS